MKSEAISKVCAKVYNRYPKLAGKKPKVTEQSEGKYLLVFNTKDDLPGGKSINQTIRVVADEAGNTVKISSSRG